MLPSRGALHGLSLFQYGMRPSLAILLANSGLSLTTPSSRIVKSAGCNASDFRNPSTALSTFGRSGSIISNTKAGAPSRSWCRRSGLPRRPRKRGGKAKHPGLYFENIPVLVARDREAREKGSRPLQHAFPRANGVKSTSRGYCGPGKRSLSTPSRSSLDAAPSQSPAYDTLSSRVFAALKSAV